MVQFILRGVAGSLGRRGNDVKCQALPVHSPGGLRSFLLWACLGWGHDVLLHAHLLLHVSRGSLGPAPPVSVVVVSHFEALFRLSGDLPGRLARSRGSRGYCGCCGSQVSLRSAEHLQRHQQTLHVRRKRGRPAECDDKVILPECWIAPRFVT